MVNSAVSYQGLPVRNLKLATGRYEEGFPGKRPQVRHPNKPGRMNTLDGRTWTKYSVSIWDMVKAGDERKIGHPAMFPVELCRRLIEIYTIKGELVIDPFVGSGSSVIAAQALHRRGVGLDINPNFVELTKKRLREGRSTRQSGRVHVHCDNSLHLLKYVRRGTADLCITSPPYWSVHSRKRSADGKNPRPYSQLPGDIGNVAEYERFMAILERFFVQVRRALKSGGRCVIIVMDLRVGSMFIPFHIDVVTMMRRLGFVFEDLVVWNKSRGYNHLRPLGYPYKFVVNKVHEYILVFRKDHLDSFLRSSNSSTEL